jgi:hypothetical protein
VLLGLSHLSLNLQERAKIVLSARRKLATHVLLMEAHQSLTRNINVSETEKFINGFNGFK